MQADADAPAPTATHGDACGPRPQVAPPTAAAGSTCGQNCVQIPDDAVMLSWRQLQWPQHCNMNADGGGAQRPPARCFCISSPRMEAGDRQEVLPPSCDRTSCCEGRLHHLEDAFAACCQAQVVPALWSCGAQQTSIPAPGLHQLSVPRLSSSISESGLDAKHLLPCCPPGSSWTNARPQQDVGTMTVHKELRDVGVQVGSGVTAHVFPQICLAETSQAPKPNRASGENPAPKSPVKEVKWDAEGMTWEVYGASVDPEELGLAIQKHLELQIKETASLAAKRSLQNPRASRGTRRSSRVSGLLRSATCCVRSPSAVE
ncbi:GRIN2-like protein [Takifugu rubripes]|uniref:GRIN2-like protein n=1 Tax=Takifugu rubripes TaxID=31033 RepID=UPI0011454328|nr:GRIN2-like protein [Takifugu rubripes]